jgi:hypothetical protein
MALHQVTHDHRTRDVLRVLAMVAAAIALAVLATAIFGMQGSGATLDIVPDPAGVSLPF